MPINQPNKMTGASLDISAENRAHLKQIFPAVFTEAINDKGELVESIDFEKLKAELGTFTDLFESRRERYGMDWPGKKDALRLIQTQSHATLKPCREESVNFDTTENLFIEGDNLEVLKLLQKSYYGKVKMIYIDPPYNTGKEFIYPDNYTESLETYLEYAGLVDGDGKKFSTNTTNEGRFHTKWLNMMFPRLYLARNLLRDDGVIFISIDDNEVSNLRKLCDEIFGEEKFVATFIWKSRQNKDNRSINGTSKDHEYILCYGRSIRGSERDASQYSNSDNDTRGPWASANMVGLATAERRPNLHYDLIDPKNGINYGCPKMGWRYDRNTMSHYIADNTVLWPSSPEGRPRRKVFLNEMESGFTGYSTIIGDSYYTKNGTAEVDDLFRFRAMDFPKPVQLLIELIEQGMGKNDIIIDFFAGSATAAHAVLDLNKQDGGNRKFILVQLPEPCTSDSEAFKAGYKTIADIGKERIRRVIKKIQDEGATTKNTKGTKKKKGQELSMFKPEGSNSTDFSLSSSSWSKNIDLGFKVFKLDKSNFKQWQKLDPSTPPEQIGEQLELHIDHISHKATPEDLLFEILIKAGFAPTEKVQTITLSDISVFSVADGGLLICLAETITKELINTVAEAEPMQFICLDSAFHGNDQLKANAVQTFAARNMGREKANQIVFRTI